MTKVFVLMTGIVGDDQGYPIAVFKNKKDLRKFVKSEFPKAKGTNRIEPDEMYWENDLGWFKCDDPTPLLQGDECTKPLEWPISP
jgi:hypothetical protein